MVGLKFARSSIAVLVVFAPSTTVFGQDAYQCVDPKSMAVRYQQAVCPANWIARPAWRTDQTPSGWTTDAPVGAIHQARVQAPNRSGLLNDLAGGVVGGGGVLLILGLSVWLIRILFGIGKSVAGKTVEVAARTSAADIARAAGSVVGVAERKSRKLRDAFNEGRSDEK